MATEMGVYRFWFGDIWERHDAGYWICVTTNGIVKKNGCAVMGKGIALEAAKRYPKLPRLVGQMLETAGNRVYAFPSLRIFSFPTKYHWREQSDLCLILDSCTQLNHHLSAREIKHVYLPTPGCGCGGLRWADVFKRIKHTISGSRIIICISRDDYLKWLKAEQMSMSSLTMRNEYNDVNFA